MTPGIQDIRKKLGSNYDEQAIFLIQVTIYKKTTYFRFACTSINMLVFLNFNLHFKIFVLYIEKQSIYFS